MHGTELDHGKICASFFILISKKKLEYLQVIIKRQHNLIRISGMIKRDDNNGGGPVDVKRRIYFLIGLVTIQFFSVPFIKKEGFMDLPMERTLPPLLHSFQI